MSTLYCDVVAKDRTLFTGELYSITVPGLEGDIGILENHDPYLGKKGIRNRSYYLRCKYGWLLAGS